jgi:hypothetical protein
VSGVHASALAGGNARGDRRKDDFYPTLNDAVTAALIECEGDRWRELGGRLCEPAAGAGHMVHQLRGAGFDCTASDKVDRDLDGCAIQSFYDFTRDTWDGRLHITNPPFVECNEGKRSRWIVHAKSIGTPYMALMLPIQWDAAADRQLIFREHWRPARKRVLTFRPDWTGDGRPTAYVAWYIWDGDPVDGAPVATTYHGAPKGASRNLSAHIYDDSSAPVQFDMDLGIVE